MTELTDAYLERAALSGIANDPRALESVRWDTVVERPDAAGRVQRIGYSETAGETYVLPPVERQAAPAAGVPEEAPPPAVRQVIEDGVSFDVETRPDGSEWLLGRTGRPAGVAVMLRPAGGAEAVGAGVEGQVGPGGPPGPAELPEGPPEAAGTPFPEILRDVGIGGLAGLNRAIFEIGEATRLNELADWLQEKFPLPTLEIPAPETTAGLIAEGLVQGGTAMIPAARATRALGAVSGFLRWTAAGALVDLLAFGPDDPGIGDLAAQLGTLDSPTLEAVRATIADGLAKDEDDTEIVKRLKNMGGGVLAGAVIDGLQVLYRAAKGLRNLPAAFQAVGKAGAAGAAMIPSEAAGVAMTEPEEPAERVEGERIAGLFERLLKPFLKSAEKAPEAVVEAIPKVVPIGRISTTEEAMAAFEVVARQKEAEIEVARRGVVSLEQTAAAGRALERETLDLMGTERDSVREFMESLASDVKSLDARLHAAREMLTASMEETVIRAQAVATKALPDVTDQQLFDFLEQEIRHGELQILFTGTRAEIGRALGSFRTVAEASASVSLSAQERRAQVIAEAIHQAGGRNAIQQRARALLETPVEKRGRLVRKMQNATAWDVIQEIYINNLLYGLRTQEINFASTQLFMLWQVPVRYYAGVIGATRRLLGGEGGVELNEGTALMLGYLEAFPKAAKAAWQVARTGTPADPLQKIEAAQFQSIRSDRLGLDPASVLGKFVDLYGVAQRAPGRFLITVDEFNKGLAQQMERRAQAVRFASQAERTGKTEAEAARLYADVMAGNVEAVEDAARSFADVVTFTRQLGEKGRAVQTAFRRVPGAFVIAPFIRTPTDLVKEFMYAGPQAVFAPQVYRDLIAGGARRDIAIARISMGSAAMAWAATLAMEGKITGFGPVDFRQRQIWLEKNQPYSINLRKVLGDSLFETMGLESEWLSYRRLDPLSELFGVAADYTQYKMWVPPDELNVGEDDRLAMDAVAVVLRNVGERTWLMGLGEAAEAFNEPERFAERYIANVLSRVVPVIGTTMMGDIESVVDPTRRDVRRDPNETNFAWNYFYSTLNKIMERTPGLSDKLPPRLNFWGEEIQAFEGNWVNAFNAFAPRRNKAEAIDEELIRLRYPWGMPARSAYGIRLTPEQYHTLVKAMNEVTAPHPTERDRPLTLRKMLNWLVDSVYYKFLPTVEEKTDELTRIRDLYLDAAKWAMVDPTTAHYDGGLAAASIGHRLGTGTPDVLEPQP